MGVQLDKMFGAKPSFLRIEPGQCLVPPQFVLYGTRIRDLEVYEDDVWLISYPRTGKFPSKSLVTNFHRSVFFNRPPLANRRQQLGAGDGVVYRERFRLRESENFSGRT